MTWLTENWFWILTFIAFVAMHLFGHGGHGVHGGDKRSQPLDGSDAAQGGAAKASSSSHQR